MDEMKNGREEIAITPVARSGVVGQNDGLRTSPESKKKISFFWKHAKTVCEQENKKYTDRWDFRLKRYLDEIYIRSTLRKEGGPTGIPIPSQCYGNRNLPYQGRERENRGKNIPPPNNLHEVVLDTLICVCDSVYRKCQGGAERIVFTVPTFQKISPNIFYK
ncbi:hypothetical protein AVEN_245870-1 [Araneus ventricosus]|uniref:Uncharacterized protein n=1 Tax=Araneus ventricosus TaxID=182803 RepID=A0A4Y2TLP4_ARAVE|nr:hypothetical protein AVEN_245870-1 [Araneus ventricosus]